MVIHGPPGTGKSQTIDNVISNLLAREKTVLFVCEKQVALDVVYKRLTVKDHASVADLCLPLFRYASDKKRFAADIIDSRNSLIREIRADRNYDLSKIITERRKKLDFLKEYAEEIIKKIEPLEKNLYWIFGQLAKISEKSKELSISWKDKESPIKLSVKDIINHKQALKGLNPFISLLEEKSSSWNGLKRRHFSPDFTARTTDVLKEMKEHLSISPYNNDKVKYLSIEKAMDFSQKVTDDNFLNLFDTELLNLKKIGHKYLEELVKKIQLISQNSLKYQTTNRNSEFEFAEYWEIVKELKNSFTNEKISLEAIYANQFAQTVGWLADSTKKLSSGIPNSILDLSVKDFESIAFLFGIDPLLTSIVYKSKTDLYDLLNQLKQFESLHNQLQSCHEILDKYGVNFSLISKEEVLRLEDLFIKKYKTFFRIFSTSYRREKADIISWCGLIKPESHSEVKNICFAVATRLKLSAKLDDEWQKVEKNFKLSSEARKLPLHYFTTIIESVVSYLTRTSLEFIEPYLQKIILDEKKSAIMGIKAQVILKVIFEYKKVRSFLNFDIFDQKIYDLEHTFKTLSEEVSLTKSLAEKVEKFKHYHKEITVQDVQEDVIILNKLKEIVSDTKKLDYLEIIRSDIKTILVDVEFLPKVLEFSNILLKISRDISETNFDDLKNVISSIRNDKVNVNSWNDKFRKLLSELSNLFENEDLGEIYLSYSLNSISDLLSSLIKDQEGLKLWIEYQKQRHLIEELGLGWFILELAHKIGNGEYEVDEVYYWVLLNKWLEDYTRTKPILRDFSKQKYQKIIEEFKKLEIESLEINKKRILRKSLVNLESSKNHGGDAEKVLKREAEKKRQHIPIRTLVREYASHLQTIKPCWMVSPLALSSYLEYGKVSFDVVIFDEASQMRIENSLGAISRAKQVVVIGDEHQLPPTPFFGFSLEDDDDDDEDDGVAEETGFESILQRSISLLNGSEEYLKYHYRSASEDLIAFSNHYIYKKFGRQLITFPNAIKRIDQGVHFEFVKDGLYEGGRDGTRTNPKEAERVANLCIRLSEENNGSLGVIAFSKSQEKAIRNALEEKIKSYPHLAEKLDETSPEKESFFIKNLESVQGDERDRIILSVCYGPDKLTGKVRNHFGPINQSNGYRRLNVAVTRAKKQLICVTSMRAYDMHPPEGSFGAKLLQKYLEYAEKGRSALEASTIVEDNTDVEADSEFELSVEAELSRRGYIVHRQVGASGFKIDLAIVNPKNNNEYILGIECDGASYHSTKSARMRDRIRQDILEKLGWRIYRIWSQHWFEHKNDVIEDIVSYCNSIK